MLFCTDQLASRNIKVSNVEQDGELKNVAERVCKGYSKLSNVATGAIDHTDTLELIVGHSCRSVLPRPGNKMGKVDRFIDRDNSAISQLVHVDVIRVTRINVLVVAFQDHTENGIRAASC